MELAVIIPNEPESAVQAAVVENIRWQMAEDRKISALKSFQGYMWEEGYARGELSGMMYDDVVPGLEKWTAEFNKKVYIYSSGSIAAQKLIFGFSNKGDLLHYISGHYDTTIGAKTSTDSYVTIARDLNKAPSSILFISDNIKEIHAAKKAGFQVAISDRPGNAAIEPTHTASLTVITSFARVFEKGVLKRREVERSRSRSPGRKDEREESSSETSKKAG